MLMYAGHRHSVRIVNGSLRRWVPLAVLALFAAAEFAAQYLFIATPFAQAVGIPDSALRFIEVWPAIRIPLLAAWLVMGCMWQCMSLRSCFV